jgi:hypothetical protein
VQFDTFEGWRASLVLPHDFEKTEDFYRAGNSGNLSNAEDKQTLLALRKAADVIITTGRTAREEKYRGSKYAPIGILTSKPETLVDLDLFETETKNFSFDCAGAKLSDCLAAKLREGGYVSPLFEGGLATLRELASGLSKIQLVLSITGGTKPDELDAAHFVHAVLPEMTVNELKSMVTGSNLVIQATLLNP